MQLSHSDIRDLLNKAINKGRTAYSPDSSWVRDVYDDHFIYADAKDKLYTRTYSIDAATNEVTLGDATEVVQTTAYTPVKTSSFALAGVATFANDEIVTRRGPIFKAGDYRDVGYSMTEQELADAVSAFQPVPVDLDHHETVLDGKLGTLKQVELGEGGVLFGTVELPKWLDDALGDVERKVSCTWDRATKQLRKLALTNNPRVPDAAIFKAFAQFAGARHSSADMADLQAIHDFAVKQGALCTPAAMSIINPTQPNPNQQEKKKMGFKERWNAFINGKSTEELEAITPEQLAEFAKADPPAADPPAPSAQPDPKVMALEQQVASQQAQIAKFAQERRQERAESTVDTLIRENRLFPSERAVTIAVFAQAMADDERDAALVTFTSSDGKQVEGTRAQMLEAQYRSRLPHSLTVEQIAAFALPNSADTPQTQHQKEVEEYARLFPELKTTGNGASPK